MAKARKIFVSHARRDAMLAAQIVKALKDRGLDTLDAASLSPGDNWRQAVRDAVKRSSALVVVLASPEAGTNAWLGYEVGMAEALGIPVLVVVSRNFPGSSMPSDLRDIQAIAFDPANPAAAADALAARIVAQAA
jgi:hypothetical protein